MNAYEVINTNAENIGACTFCHHKPGRTEGHRRKCDWLKERYAEGLRFKVLRSREFGDIGMIEYAPGSHAWRPVEAEGYFVIHCLMINSKHQGRGLAAILLDDCLRDAKKNRRRGVAVVTSGDFLMAGGISLLKPASSRWIAAPHTSCSSGNSRQQPRILVSASTGSES
jgi:hypothetical protein